MPKLVTTLIIYLIQKIKILNYLKLIYETKSNYVNSLYYHYSVY